MAAEDGRRMSRRWPAAGRRVWCRAEQGKEKGEAAGGPGRGKIKKTSLKFETKVFPS